MKKLTKLFIAGTAVVTLGTGIGFASTAFSHRDSVQAATDVSTTPLPSTPAVTENLTIAAALQKFATEKDFEASPIAGIGGKLSDDTVLIKDTSGDDGWLGLPPGPSDQIAAKIVDTRTGQVLDSFTRNDPRGATIAQIKAALTARDNAK